MLRDNFSSQLQCFTSIKTSNKDIYDSKHVNEDDYSDLVFNLDVYTKTCSTRGLHSALSLCNILASLVQSLAVATLGSCLESYCEVPGRVTQLSLDSFQSRFNTERLPNTVLPRLLPHVTVVSVASGRRQRTSDSSGVSLPITIGNF